MSLEEQNNNQKKKKQKKSLSTIVFVAAVRQTLELSDSLRLRFSSRLGLGGLSPQLLVILCMWEETRDDFKKGKTVPLRARSSSALPSVRVVLLLFPPLCLCCCCLAEYLSSSVALSAFSG